MIKISWQKKALFLPILTMTLAPFIVILTNSGVFFEKFDIVKSGFPNQISGDFIMSS